jgi:basic amino acid/polyamine antiporter, APA family
MSVVLVRAIGRAAMTGLVVNIIIGSSVFGLPGELQRLLGRASPLVMLAGALCIAVFAACAAELAAKFPEAGGSYLYVRRTFGRFAGLIVAWFWLLASVSGMAMGINLIAAYLSGLSPVLSGPWMRAIIGAVVIAIPVAVNCRGVRGGAVLSTSTLLVKCAPLVLLIVLGVARFGSVDALPRASDLVVPGRHAWATALLMTMNFYGGWEDALAPAGEVKDPRRTVPFGLAAGLAISAAVYMVVQYVVVAVSAAPSDHPLADVARETLGESGAPLVTLAAVLSVYGYLTASVLTFPRALYALAAEGDWPPLLAAVHPRFRTPLYPIIAYGVLGYLFALSGTYVWIAALSAGATVVAYGGICAALVRQRRLPSGAEPATLRIPFGRTLGVFGLGVSIVMVAQLDTGRLTLMFGTVAIAAVNWLWAARVSSQRRAVTSG